MNARTRADLRLLATVLVLVALLAAPATGSLAVLAAGGLGLVTVVALSPSRVGRRL